MLKRQRDGITIWRCSLHNKTINCPATLSKLVISLSVDPGGISMDKKWKLRLPWKCRKRKRPRYASNKVCALTSPILFSIMHMCFADQRAHQR